MNRHLSFAECVRYERGRHGWSQEEVASKIGCTAKTVGRWESGKSVPYMYHRQKISELFDKDLEAFSLVLEPASDTTDAQIERQSGSLSEVSSPEALPPPHAQSIETTTPPVCYSQDAVFQGIRGLPPPTHPRSIEQRERVVKHVYAQLLQTDLTALVLTGLGGVGKSTLAALVYRYAFERFQAGSDEFTAEPVWLTISQRVTITDIVGTLLEILGKPLPHLGEMTPSNQIMALFRALSAEPKARLIVLDQFENALDCQTGYALLERPGIGEWLDVMNSQPCACKLLLTSRIWPRGTCDYPPTYMQEYHTEGLNLSEGMELLRKQGIGTKRANDMQLRKAVTRCSGHALALTLLASLLRQDQSLSLSLLFRSPLYTRLWQGNIARSFLDFVYIKQLNELQRKLLSAFSVYREAVPLEATLAILDLQEQDEAQVPFSFNTLLAQHLIQASGRGAYHLHAIVADYVCERSTSMDEGACQLLHAHSRAAQYYLQLAVVYCPPPEERKSVSDVQPLIEATWHLCQAEQWQAACNLISQEELYQTLRSLGENAILLELYRLLQPSEKWRPEQMKEAEIYDHLGRMYAVRGEKELALDNYKRALQTYEAIGTCQGKGRTLHHLGLLYESLGQNVQAKAFHEQAVIVSQETGDNKGEADSLNGLGWICHRLGQHEEALRFCQQSRDIHHEKGNSVGESDALNALGLIYHKLQKMDQALQCHERALSMRREVGNREREGKTLNNLGLVYADLGQVEKAREHYREAFIIRKRIGDRKGEGLALHNLSKMYFKCHHYELALAGFLHARTIFKGIWRSEYEATERWIETLQISIGKEEFIDLLAQIVEASASKTPEEIFNVDATFHPQ